MASIDNVQSLTMRSGLRDLPNKKEKVRFVLDCICKLDRRTGEPLKAKYNRGDIAHPNFFHHVCHRLHRGIMIVPGKVIQNAEGRNLAAPTRAREISCCQRHPAVYDSLSRLELGEATCERGRDQELSDGAHDRVATDFRRAR